MILAVANSRGRPQRVAILNARLSWQTMALNDTINNLCQAEDRERILDKNKHSWDLQKRQARNPYAIRLVKNKARLWEGGDPSAEGKGNAVPLEDSKRRR